MHQGRRSRQLTIKPVYWQRQAISGSYNKYVYILCLRCEDTIHTTVILYTGLPIIKTSADEWSLAIW